MNEARILYTVGKKDFILQSKGAHFEKFRRRATRGEITLRFLAALRAAQHGLYTSNLLPTPMWCYIKQHHHAFLVFYNQTLSSGLTLLTLL